MTNNKVISVIGCGTMGNGISHVCALNGFNVFLVDLNQEILDSSIMKIDNNLNKQLNRGKITAEEKKMALNNITTTLLIEYGELYSPTDFGLTSSVNEWMENFEAFFA